METRANYIAVGLFTILTILAAFGFVYWQAGTVDQGEQVTLRVRIPGSASGLGRGSAVLFNGVRVGDVRRVYIDVNNPSAAVADARVDRLTPITASTRADIGLAGLTGQANIELRGGGVGEPNILQLAEEENQVAEITANPSAVTNLLQSAQSILTRADSVLNSLEGFVDEARAPLMETVNNVERFSAALGRNADDIDTFLENVGRLSQTLGNASDQLATTLASVEDILNSVDREQVTSIVANVEEMTTRFRDASGELQTIMTGVGEAVTSVNAFAENAGSAIERVDRLLEGVDPASVRTALTNVEQASTTVNRAVNDIAGVTERIGARADDIDATISDARQLAERLNQASARVDGILVRVDGLLGSGEAEGLMADASETLASFRQVADTLNARIGVISDGLARFSGQGLQEVESLVRDGRRSIIRIERAITDLERNPQRIITGGSGSVREYDGRARR